MKEKTLKTKFQLYFYGILHIISQQLNSHSSFTKVTASSVKETNAMNLNALFHTILSFLTKKKVLLSDSSNLKEFLKTIAMPLIVGGFSGLLNREAIQAFSDLKQPPLSPPAILFPVVWTLLYLFMGISFYLIKTSGARRSACSDAQAVYFYQLTVNFLWPVFFFSFGWHLFSFFILLLLWGLVYKMIRCFYKVSAWAALLNLPYLLWLTFAAYLNFGVWLLNR